MDHSHRPPKKTYSESMNEWAAQREFVQGGRSRLLHPPWDAHPVAKVFGYLIRLLLLLAVPLVIYVILLINHGGSREFNKMVSDGIATALDAESAETKSARWGLDGVLTVKSLEARGLPSAFYEKLRAEGLSTRIPFPAVFHRDWVLPRVSMDELSIALRSGGRGAVPTELLQDGPEMDISLPSLLPDSGLTPAKDNSGRLPSLLREGYGIQPDFKTIRINGLQAARLNTVWGSNPSSTGFLKGMQTDFVRTAGGWTVSGNGGKFSQGWLENLPVGKLALEVGKDEVRIEEVLLTLPGDGPCRLTGSLTLGELPTVQAEMTVSIPEVQGLVTPAIGSLFTAEAEGTIRLSGSVNRSTGIRMDGSLKLLSGRLKALPVMEALQRLTGESQFRLLSVNSGEVEFFSEGMEGTGGQVVEVKSMTADCGPMARLRGHYRQEQIIEAQQMTLTAPEDQTRFSGSFGVGIPEKLLAKLKPVVAERFFRQEADGWAWLEIPLQGPPGANFSRAVATEMIRVDREAAP